MRREPKFPTENTISRKNRPSSAGNFQATTNTATVTMVVPVQRRTQVFATNRVVGMRARKGDNEINCSRVTNTDAWRRFNGLPHVSLSRRDRRRCKPLASFRNERRKHDVDLSRRERDGRIVNHGRPITRSSRVFHASLFGLEQFTRVFRDLGYLFTGAARALGSTN